MLSLTHNFFFILVSGILAAIDTFSEHVMIGVSWVVHTLFLSDICCLPNLGVIRINTSLFQIFYFVGFALFCLETLLSIGVLQVWKFFSLDNHHSATLTFQCFYKLVDVPLCNSILDQLISGPFLVLKSEVCIHINILWTLMLEKKSTYTLRYPGAYFTRSTYKTWYSTH